MQELMRAVSVRRSRTGRVGNPQHCPVLEKLPGAYEPNSSRSPLPYPGLL